MDFPTLQLMMASNAIQSYFQMRSEKAQALKVHVTGLMHQSNVRM